MATRPHTAEEGLLSSLERWAPADAELWTEWRRTLAPKQRSEALLPLQAALSGLSAFRHLENHAPASAPSDFQSSLHAARATWVWALTLAGELDGEREPARRLDEPIASLRMLQQSLAEALQESDALMQRPVDAAALQWACDRFVRDLEGNRFFQPPDPLEFSNVDELIGPERLTASLGSFTSDAAKTTTIIAFLALLRNHRFLGIADRQIGADDGLYRAHVLLAGVRRELRVLVRFILVQGVEAFADELEARLLALDADRIPSARDEIARASDELGELREAVESLAMDVHGTLRISLDDPLPELGANLGLALPSERMRNGIRALRRSIKRAAKEIWHLVAPSAPADERRESRQVERSLHQDIWAFRLILRAFLAKASAAPARADRWCDVENLAFTSDFVRHFRTFGPRLAKGTGYPRRGALIAAVSGLSHLGEMDSDKLHLAAIECARFLTHLDQAIDDAPHSLLAPFDKRKAAAELRGYLAAARDRADVERASAGAFGPIGGRVAAS